MAHISEGIVEKVYEKFIPYMEGMADEGHSPEDISHRVLKIVDQISLNFWKEEYRKPRSTGEIMPWLLDGEGKQDSKAEQIFFFMLHKNKILFQFQVEIGPYRVDYLVGNRLVVEGDGPHHKGQVDYDERRDEYLRSKGYLVLRFEWRMLAMAHKEIIETIKEITMEEADRLAEELKSNQ